MTPDEPTPAMQNPEKDPDEWTTGESFGQEDGGLIDDQSRPLRAQRRYQLHQSKWRLIWDDRRAVAERTLNGHEAKEKAMDQTGV